MDEKPQHIVEGYDCFSIYKHSDNSYEWRLCKVVGKVLKPQFKVNQYAQTLVKNGNKIQASSFGELENQDGELVVDESDKYFYYLEFEHLKDYGREMWCKRRREDILLSSVYERTNPSFRRTCKTFVQQQYKS